MRCQDKSLELSCDSVWWHRFLWPHIDCCREAIIRHSCKECFEVYDGCATDEDDTCPFGDQIQLLGAQEVLAGICGSGEDENERAEGGQKSVQLLARSSHRCECYPAGCFRSSASCFAVFLSVSNLVVSSR